MSNKTEHEKDSLRRSRTAWLWVLMCAAGIFSTVPMARGVQRYVSHTIGKDFFTYFVLSIFFTLFAALLCFLIFRPKVNSASQYIWLIICAGLYIYLTIQLRKYPEEAIHLLEYGLLTWFIFKALSYKIRDWTIYITAALIASLFGIADEFLQWMMPNRVWSYKDAGINALGAGIFILAISKGIRPGIISKPVKRSSINIMTGTIIAVLIIIGLCLSNTPDAVKRYTTIFNNLSWLNDEEPMTVYGYEYVNPETGASHVRTSNKSGNKYSSGKIITSFSPRTAWFFILAMIGVLWTCGEFWKRRLDDD